MGFDVHVQLMSEEKKYEFVFESFPNGEMDVCEYHPTFFQGFDRQKTRVKDESEILEIPWLKQKGDLYISDDCVKWKDNNWVAANIIRGKTIIKEIKPCS